LEEPLLSNAGGAVIEVETVADAGRVVKMRMARTLFGRPAYFTAAYWVDGLLIDTGCARTAGQLVGAIQEWQVNRVVNTHSHEDHIGANAEVQARYGCPVLAHPDALPILHNPRLQPLQPYRRLFWGWPKPSEGQAIGTWVETEHYRFQVIHTPGHSPDHICLFEPEQGWLFSGDAYIGGKDRALRAGYDIQQILCSLQRLAELPVRILFPGSGTVRENGAEALEEKISYLEQLGQEIRALRHQGLTARRIQRRLLGRELPIATLTLGHFSGMRLIRSYLAGLPPEMNGEGSNESAGTAEDESGPPALGAG
jgi:glyoxylase-like metal-dependent hydrolase (beta-lactamase superfamily II)